jgi:hypothetical protein
VAEDTSEDTTDEFVEKHTEAVSAEKALEMLPSEDEFEAEFDD